MDEPYISTVGDTISIHNSSGTTGHPILVHDNLIVGAYRQDPSADFPGGGILLGDACDAAHPNEFQEAYNNTVIQTSNYGIAIANGRSESIHDNTIVGTGKLADGTLLDSSDDAGIYVRNFCGTNAAHDATTAVAQNNTVGWGNPSSSNASARNDTYTAAGNVDGSILNTTHIQPYNSASNSGVVDPQAMDNAITAWQQSVSSNSVVVGPH